MNLDPVPLLAPVPEAPRVSKPTFWSTVLGTCLLGGLLGFGAAGADGASSDGAGAAASDHVPVPDPADPNAERAELRAWLATKSNASPIELAPDALRVIEAVEQLGDPTFLPLVEQLALAVLEEDPALESQRVALASGLFERIPFLPASELLARLRARLALVR